MRYELSPVPTERLKHAAMRELFTRGLRGEASKRTEWAYSGSLDFDVPYATLPTMLAFS